MESRLYTDIVQALFWLFQRGTKQWILIPSELIWNSNSKGRRDPLLYMSGVEAISQESHNLNGNDRAKRQTHPSYLSKGNYIYNIAFYAWSMLAKPVFPKLFIVTKMFWPLDRLGTHPCLLCSAASDSLLSPCVAFYRASYLCLLKCTSFIFYSWKIYSSVNSYAWLPRLVIMHPRGRPAERPFSCSTVPMRSN
jgi:hypothetical protein